MRLNLGSGPHPAEGWVNVDSDAGLYSVGVDVVHDLAEPLPFSDGSAEAVFCSHLLEHIDWRDVPAVLADIRRVLRPDGWLCVVGPDLARTALEWREGREPFEMILSVAEHAHGWDDGLGFRHRWTCGSDRVVWALTAAGFGYVEDLPMHSRRLDEWPLLNRGRWQCAVVGQHDPLAEPVLLPLDPYGRIVR